MTPLIKLLRQAHAGEIGAYNAYEGHWRSLPLDSDEREKIKFIQADELIHKENVEAMLKELGAKASWAQDAFLWIIGKSISAACYVMSYKMAMWGARMIERLGTIGYNRIAIEALREGRRDMVVKLMDMQRMEQDHEKYFMSILKPQCICRYLRYLNGSTAREINVFCKAEHKY